MQPTRGLAVLSVALTVSLLSGCLPLNVLRTEPKVNPVDVKDTKATPATLVRYLNDQAALVTSVKAHLEADASQGGQAIALGGHLACEKPRGFRLRASVAGISAVDIGSNNDEFWFWMKQRSGPAPLLYCSYRDLATGKVNVPTPFQPEMVLVALGMATYDPEGKYTLKDNKKTNTLDLSLETNGLNGKAVTRTVTFRRSIARAGQPQVLGHTLRDENGKIVCEAKVETVHTDRATGAVVPSKVKISWPAEKASITLMLSRIEVNTLTKAVTGDLFARTAIPGQPSYNLATRHPDASATARRGTR